MEFVTENYSQGCDLWIVPYKSPCYQQLDWWTQFSLSRFTDEEKLDSGQLVLVGTGEYLPNKWTLIYTGLEKNANALFEIHRTWKNLGEVPTRFFVDSGKNKTMAEEVWCADEDTPIAFCKSDVSLHI